ncbi:3-oxosteroid 1-dehydrogenase [Tsukamurella pulmonis]|uniref:3-oxosteroid 1-dehydrogenase n=1 Tax=Tsukamurella pulmonis TaxID=47312 RepID=A0A1H1BIG4_9ACTN|nr:3-oxosteroid 1-dehydrogenase [Tsukamurella pulmonis]KXO90330.1 3-ketosteroid-delta-1-dehydrogenase [Tsukamurella pulmonis]BDD84426.1 3-oxosteroid 1-dehydrogenase [Tsukamurella pulmonis]SDQ51663.1 3-oxosteroid 1-dehydrogenase [Tsukamurella pulmonis]SUP25133.1 3-oxosteroid 1-dehydrogenase [Tsukamurella pulmonis]
MTAETTEYDVIVVGSGAAGMTAALKAADTGLSVLVVEKAAHYGGSTARSGGGVWVPGNEALVKAGIKDTPDEARKYLHSIIGDVVPAERIDTYIDRGPEVISMVHRMSPLQLTWVPGYSDYYPEAPGGRAHGRSCEPKPFDGKQLGEELRNLEPDYTKAPMNLVVTQADFKWLNLIMRHPKGPLRALRVAGRYYGARVRGKHLLGRGQALIAALRVGLQRAGVPLWLNTSLVELTQEDGRVTGVAVERDGERLSLTARRGVILAAGGFESSAEMRAQYQRQPIGTEWTNGVPANTGDAIRAGEAVGGALEFMDDAWWGPSIQLPKMAWFALSERSLPGSVMVNTAGERFVNESAPYVEAVHAMYGGEHGQGEGPGENVPCWLVFDQRYRNRYMFAGQPPRQPLPKRWYESGCMVRANTLAELAAKMDVPAETLTATVEKFNGFARAGRDEDFHRGESAYDRYYGDPRNKPNASLAELSTGPFYAARMVPGDLGTKGGLRTDVAGRVQRADGSAIEGLYAAGNTSSPVMGHTYAGPGATIGPAMVFAYLAVEDMARQDTAPAAAAPARAEEEIA